MAMRGVEKQNSFAITSAMLGAFPSDARTRAEFLELIRRPELKARGAATRSIISSAAEPWVRIVTF